MKKNIAFIVPYPIGVAPSQRFRFEQYLSLLKNEGIQYTCFPFLSIKDFKIIYNQGFFFKKTLSIFNGFFRRSILMFRLTKYDTVFIHREASPVGPPVFEWLIAKILKRKIIYDFDDAIWLENTSQSNQLISKIKSHSKVASICNWASLVMCGNKFLMSFAKKYNMNVVYMPTTIDIENEHNKIKHHEKKQVVIGWTGTHSTIKYLYEIESVLSKLQQKLIFEFRVISNKDPLFTKIKYHYIPWNKNKEIQDLLKIDIGIMPLLDNEWARGKCAFKALQYMALGIPCVISPVGVNNEIVKDGVNGILAENDEEWREKLTKLIETVEIRAEIGLEGLKTVHEKYSVLANQRKFISYLKNNELK
ncbi:MAG: glycosyltransferase family 4 protein [Flavobacteriales bacterium]|nr:glycosyltransferase family 4 protein [Flavobacteriales bacterium]